MLSGCLTPMFARLLFLINCLIIEFIRLRLRGSCLYERSSWLLARSKSLEMYDDTPIVVQ